MRKFRTTCLGCYKIIRFRAMRKAEMLGFYRAYSFPFIPDGVQDLDQAEIWKMIGD